MQYYATMPVLTGNKLVKSYQNCCVVGGAGGTLTDLTVIAAIK